MEEITVFLFLRLSLIICFFFYGLQISKGQKYWVYMIPCILFFSLNEGLRFGRGADYNGYFFKYPDILSGRADQANEFLFQLFCKFNDFLGLPYQGLIFLMSLVLAISAAIFLKDHKKIIGFALPLFYLFSIEAENLMRWFLGFSFIFIGISYLNKGKYIPFLSLGFIACLFHNGLAMVIPIFLGVYFIKRPILYPLLAIGIYLGLYFLFSTEYMKGIASVISKLSVSDQYANYTENAEDWLTGTANYEAKGINIGVALTDILTICIGFNIIKYIPKLTYYFNLYLIGVVLSPAFYQIEILLRVCMLFKLFQFIILGYAFYVFLWRKKRMDKYSHIFTWIIFLNLIRIYVVNVFFIEDTDAILYIWDSMGRNFLRTKY